MCVRPRKSPLDGGLGQDILLGHAVDGGFEDDVLPESPIGGEFGGVDAPEDADDGAWVRYEGPMSVQFPTRPVPDHHVAACASTSSTRLTHACLPSKTIAYSWTGDAPAATSSTAY